MAFKKIKFLNSQIEIHGSEHDPYFRSLGDHDHTNDFYTSALAHTSRNSVILDVGANVGLTAVMAAQRAGHVYSFEPSPAVFGYLQQTIQANGLGATITPINMALGDREGDLRFFNNPISGSASHLVTAGTLAEETADIVRVTTIDRFCQEKQIEDIDLIKIDVEGFEIDTLRGAAETIQKNQASALIEFNSFTMICFRNINPRELLVEIRSIFPYVYRWRDGFSLIDTDDDALKFVHDNLVLHGSVDDLYGTFEPKA